MEIDLKSSLYIKIIKEAINRKKEQSKNYNQRVFAKKIKTSPSFVSAIINGRKIVPINKIELIIKELELGPSTIQIFRKSCYLATLPPKINKQISTELSKNELSSFVLDLNERDINILENWQTIAVLDLITCDDFQSNLQWIAGKINSTKREVAIILVKLVQARLIKEIDGNWIKTNKALYIPTTKSHRVVREYHEQMIRLGLEQLNTKATQDDFQNRYIGSISFATDPKNIETAKEKLINCLQEIADLSREGHCTQVYQLNTQFFPLIK